jgi:hypothetical protein
MAAWDFLEASRTNLTIKPRTLLPPYPLPSRGDLWHEQTDRTVQQERQIAAAKFDLRVHRLEAVAFVARCRNHVKELVGVPIWALV